MKGKAKFPGKMASDSNASSRPFKSTFKVCISCRAIKKQEKNNSEPMQMTCLCAFWKGKS